MVACRYPTIPVTSCWGLLLETDRLWCQAWFVIITSLISCLNSQSQIISFHYATVLSKSSLTFREYQNSKRPSMVKHTSSQHLSPLSTVVLIQLHCIPLSSVVFNNMVLHICTLPFNMPLTEYSNATQQSYNALRFANSVFGTRSVKWVYHFSGIWCIRNHG